MILKVSDPLNFYSWKIVVLFEMFINLAIKLIQESIKKKSFEIYIHTTLSLFLKQISRCRCFSNKFLVVVVSSVSLERIFK